jgi:hypothetical protein
MHDASTKSTPISPGRRRAERSADALISRYILELSGRHGRPTAVPRRTVSAEPAEVQP